MDYSIRNGKLLLNIIGISAYKIRIQLVLYYISKINGTKVKHVSLTAKKKCLLYEKKSFCLTVNDFAESTLQNLK